MKPLLIQVSFNFILNSVPLWRRQIWIFCLIKSSKIVFIFTCILPDYMAYSYLSNRRVYQLSMQGDIFEKKKLSV